MSGAKIFSRRRFMAGAGAAAFLPQALAGLGKLTASSAVLSGAERTSVLARDPLRPQFHLLPAANWMNDPNGPIFFDGRYHMFYQYNPFAAVWGSMHWAHATSPDMIRWKHEPIGIAPAPGGNDSDGVFSGTIVLDNGTPTAIYTGVAPPATPQAATLKDGKHVWRETQCLAVSHDKMRSWEKLTEPVVATPPPGLAVTGFRDPCVWREGNEWRMVLGSGVAGKGGMVLLYRSPDLRRWTYLNPLIEGDQAKGSATNPVDSGDMWECPEFFALRDRHVLLISTAGKVFWKIGRYRDGRLLPEKEGTVDFGHYYAARSMLDRSGNRILWGWITEGRPEEEHRKAGWAGAMSLPRVLSLGDDGGLRMTLAREVETLRGERTRIENPTGASKTAALAAIRIRDLAAELQITFTAEDERPFSLELKSEKDEVFAAIAYNRSETERELRTNKTSAALSVAKGQPVRLRLLVDGSVLELFANETTSITERIYTVPATALRIVLSGQARVSLLELWPMKAISPDRLTS